MPREEEKDVEGGRWEEEERGEEERGEEERGGEERGGEGGRWGTTVSTTVSGRKPKKPKLFFSELSSG